MNRERSLRGGNSDAVEISKFPDCDRVVRVIVTEIFLILTDRSHANRPIEYRSGYWVRVISKSMAGASYNCDIRVKIR